MPANARIAIVSIPSGAVMAVHTIFEYPGLMVPESNTGLCFINSHPEVARISDADIMEKFRYDDPSGLFVLK